MTRNHDVYTGTILSNSPAAHVYKDSKDKERSCDTMHIRLDEVVKTKEDVKNKKPHPEIYLKIMKHYNAIPEECLVFEDSYTGVLAGKNAGIEVINIYDKYADLDRDKINKIANYSIINYKEFIDLIDSLYYNMGKIKLKSKKY